MKIKFIEAPKGRPYKAGDIVEFNGGVEEGYARKYIDRGWAEFYDEAAIKEAERQAAAAKAADDAAAKAKASAVDKAKADADAKAKADAPMGKGRGSGAT